MAGLIELAEKRVVFCQFCYRIGSLSEASAHFGAAQTISSTAFTVAARSWCFTVRSGLHALVVEPSTYS